MPKQIDAIFVYEYLKAIGISQHKAVVLAKEYGKKHGYYKKSPPNRWVYNSQAKPICNGWTRFYILYGAQIEQELNTRK